MSEKETVKSFDDRVLEELSQIRQKTSSILSLMWLVVILSLLAGCAAAFLTF